MCRARSLGTCCAFLGLIARLFQIRDLTGELLGLLLEVANLFLELGDGLGLRGRRVIALGLGPRALLVVDRGFEKVAREAGETEVIASEPGFQYRQGLLHLELANHHPSP